MKRTNLGGNFGEIMKLPTYAYYRFNMQIKKRERIYGKPLPDIQYIKSARVVSHDLYPINNEQYREGVSIKFLRGSVGYDIRDEVRKILLNSVEIKYKKQNRIYRK